MKKKKQIPTKADRNEKIQKNQNNYCKRDRNFTTQKKKMTTTTTTTEIDRDKPKIGAALREVKQNRPPNLIGREPEADRALIRTMHEPNLIDRT